MSRVGLVNHAGDGRVLWQHTGGSCGSHEERRSWGGRWREVEGRGEGQGKQEGRKRKGETVRIKGLFPLLHRCCPKVEAEGWVRATGWA